MSLLADLIELQSIHDNLRTIKRDLLDFPADLSRLDAELKQSSKRQEQLAKETSEVEKKIESLATELKLALRLEEHARVALKATTQKVQYTAAIRELDERERHRVSIAKPLKETELKLVGLQKELAELQAQSAKTQAQFDELHAIFLSEHENQVEASDRLNARLKEIEASIGASELARFNKLLQQRQGRALVVVDGGNCTGCRTKVRTPLLSQIREKGFLPCESCQRLLYIQAR